MIWFWKKTFNFKLILQLFSFRLLWILRDSKDIYDDTLAHISFRLWMSRLSWRRTKNKIYDQNKFQIIKKAIFTDYLIAKSVENTDMNACETLMKTRELRFHASAGELLGTVRCFFQNTLKCSELLGKLITFYQKFKKYHCNRQLEKILITRFLSSFRFSQISISLKWRN